MSVTLPIATKNAATTSTPEEFDLVGLLLQEQQSLTAVQRFSALHEQGEFGQTAEPDQARYYRSLLPATAPGPGQQFAFHVDLDKCSGCKACVVACHTMNGLEEDESWRRVGTITLGDSETVGSSTRIQHVTTACHHCQDPGCLNGCPVKAYDKDPVTGIVRHLDDQCIGCKYCTMMCPYEVPQYSDRLGIVRKCDMCHQRLSAGEAPACVQACPNEAISIRIVDTAEQSLTDTDRLAPGAPVSTITRPSTLYETKEKSPAKEKSPDPFLGGVAQDAGVDEVAESHWPLAAMLIATQISVGMLLAERFAATLLWAVGSSMPIEATRWNAVIAFGVAAAGMNIAPLHLGQPLRAWRVFLGLRTSWLSREAVVLGKYMGVLAVAVALLWMPVFASQLPEVITRSIPAWVAKATLGVAIPLGLAGLFSSAMIYIATKRRLWRNPRTMIRFFGTAAVGGAAWTAAVMIFEQADIAITSLVLLTAFTLASLKLKWEWQVHLGPSRDDDDDYDRRSRRLVDNELTTIKRIRVASGITAIALLACSLLAMLILPQTATLVLAAAAAVTFTAGESCERLLYFCSVVYDRMPGTLR